MNFLSECGTVGASILHRGPLRTAAEGMSIERSDGCTLDLWAVSRQNKEEVSHFLIMDIQRDELPN